MLLTSKLLRGTKMDKSTIEGLFMELDAQLEHPLEISVVGGAAMVLLDFKPSTPDVDSVTEIPEDVKDLITMIGGAHDLNNKWLNDALHGFAELPDDKSQVLWEGERLSVKGPTAEFQLLLKAESARHDKDLDDVLAIAQGLGMKVNQVESFYKRETGKPLPQNVYFHLLYSDVA